MSGIIPPTLDPEGLIQQLATVERRLAWLNARIGPLPATEAVPSAVLQVWQVKLIEWAAEDRAGLPIKHPSGTEVPATLVTEGTQDL